MDIEKICRLYSNEKVKIIATYNSSRGKDDIRITYIAELPDCTRYAIKVTSNSFTTHERVKGWAELIEHYNNLGIYCPKILLNLNGEYSADLEGNLVYAEEFKKYSTADEAEQNVTGEKKYLRKLYESIGLVAANPAPFVPWRTAYCIFDLFDATDKYDENYECAITFRNFCCEHLPEYSSLAEKLFNEYCTRRDKFESRYRILPKSVFQGDINTSNILVDTSGDFIGMIDFNLSGTESILNYAFCESFCSLEDDSEIDLLLDTAALKKRDEITAQRLAWIGRHYSFKDEEREAFNEYYNIVAPFRWTYHSFFIKLLSNREKYPEGKKYAKSILDWVEYQMTRQDAVSLLP